MPDSGAVKETGSLAPHGDTIFRENTGILGEVAGGNGDKARERAGLCQPNIKRSSNLRSRVEEISKEAKQERGKFGVLFG